jgi:glycosyltransferase 2 family protein
VVLIACVRMKRIVGIVLFAAAASLLLVVLFDTYDRLPKDVFHVRWQYAIAAVAVIAAANTVGAVVWVLVLRGQRIRMPLSAGVRILALSQLGKYLPGGIWQPVGWLEFARRAGVRRSAGGVSILVVMALTLVAALIVGPCLLALDGTAGAFLWLLLVAPIAIAALHPRVLDRLLAFGTRLLRRDVELPSLSFGVVLGGLAISIPSWLAYGGALALTAKSLNLGFADRFSLLGGAFAVAWAVGFLALPVPGGLAVREAVLMLLLRGGGIGAAEATALAIASRLYFVVAEGAMALAVLLIPKADADTSGPAESEAGLPP